MPDNTKPAVSKTVAKSPRRTPAKIQQDILDATLAKLDAAKKRRETHEAAVKKAGEDIGYLTALADNQSSHPALKKAEPDDDEPVTEPAGVTPVADKK